MTVGTYGPGTPLTALLTKRLQRNVQRLQPRRRSRAATGLGERKEVPAELGDDVRALMYALGALVAAADGISDEETIALRTLANFLAVPDLAKKAIDKAILSASSTIEGLTAVFDAYREALDSNAKQRPSGHSRSVQAARIEHVRGLAQEGVFGLPMLNAREVSELLGSRSQNQRQYAANLRRRGALIGFLRGNRYVYPKFQFDMKTRRVYPEVEIVGQILDAGNDPWGAVSWWTSPNPRLPRRQAPMDLLGTPKARDDLPSLARSMVAAIG